jgi:cytidylate kinase
MPIITIARGSTWGGQAVATKVALRLGIPCIGRETLVEAALHLDLAREGPSCKLEGGSGAYDRLAWERKTYLATIQAALAGYAMSGDLVYHGHAGHLLLRDTPSILRVRIIAPLAMRIKAVVEREKITAEEARAYIWKVDEEWVRWTRFIYGVDWRDPSLYDLVINLEHVSVDMASISILEVARQPEFESTPQVKEQLADLALGCRVKLALAVDPASKDLDLEVVASKGAVKVSGKCPEKATSKPSLRNLERSLGEIVRKVHGAESASFDFGPAPAAAESP